MTPLAANSSGRRWISAAECREYLGLKSTQTVYELFYAKKIPGARIGRTVRIDLRALEGQLEQQVKARENPNDADRFRKNPRND